jgi:hypothetical protein
MHPDEGSGIEHDACLPLYCSEGCERTGPVCDFCIHYRFTAMLLATTSTRGCVLIPLTPSHGIRRADVPTSTVRPGPTLTRS